MSDSVQVGSPCDVEPVVVSPWRRRLQSVTAIYSLFWLLAANLVGLWLAFLLVWPQLGHGLNEWTYGRWMPLHMDWQLYGWCALPLVGLLMSTYLAPRYGSRMEDLHVGFGAWSLALLLGGWLSLNGVVSGKLFLNWSGIGRIFFPVAQLVLLAVLAAGFLGAWRKRKDSKLVLWLKGLGLLALASSPVALFITAGREVYPPIDPTSGGGDGPQSAGIVARHHPDFWNDALVAPALSAGFPSVSSESVYRCLPAFVACLDADRARECDK